MRARAWMWIFAAAAALTLTASAARADETATGCASAPRHAPHRPFAASAGPASPFAGVFDALRFDSPALCDASPIEPRWDLADPADGAVAEQAPPPKAFVSSDAYHTRALIHKRASYAMLPLFISEAVIGQKMFNNPNGISSNMQTAHKTIGIAIGGLFAVNSVTGVMNMWEGRKDPQGLIRRTVHGTLMLVADLGFLATAATRP